MTPVARQYPNPLIGTAAPALPNSNMGPYIPRPVRITPAVTNKTRILAGVSLVVSIRICPIVHIIPAGYKNL